MTYQVGDVIMFRKEGTGRVPITAIIVTIYKETIYQVATKNQKHYQTRQRHIISLGNSKTIITDSIISDAVNPKYLITEFLKSVLFHLIRSTDKYDLQILAKCNQQVNEKGVYSIKNIQETLDMIYTKMKVTT